MTNFLGGSASRARSSRIVAAATALRIQNSVNGTPRPFGYGQARLAGNLGWYGNFVADAVPGSTGGGKGAGGGGGGKSGASTVGYNYYTGFLLLLCEGPIDQIVQGWENKSAFPISSNTSLGPDLTVFEGDYQQLPWSWLQETEGTTPAQNFRGLAYVADSSLFLGSNTELPNFTFDVRFNIADGLVETAMVPPSGPTTITAQYFNYDYGVLGHFVVPFGATSGLSANQLVPGLNPTVLSGLAESIDNSTLGEDWYLSNSSGVIWDQGATNGTVGQPLTRIASSLTPSTGQYTVIADATAVFTFAAADAGQPVVIVAAALSPGVSYCESVTGTLTAGSSIVSNVLPSAAGIAAPQRVLSGAGIVPGSFVTSVQSGIATGNLSSGSPTVSDVTGSFSASGGSPVSDSAGAIPSGTTVSSLTPPSITAGANSAFTVSGVTFVSSFATMAILDGTAQLTSVAAFGGIVVGALAYCDGYWSGGIEVTAFNSGAGTVQLAYNPAVLSSAAVPVTFTTEFTGSVTAGSPTISGPSQLSSVSSASTLTDSVGAFSAGVSVSAVTFGSITLSHNATANATGDTLSFEASFTLSQPATSSGTVEIVLRGAQLTQVLSSPAHGEFTLSIQNGSFGQYGFNAADAGAQMAIVDLPDANPADVLQDFLTNPYYGAAQFPAARIGDLSTYRSYCLAVGLLVSPTIINSAAANSFVSDLMKATNSEIVWANGQLTVVPYGDTALSANGATYTPPSAPLYSLDDDDFLDNQGVNPHSFSSAGSPDPVEITRLDPADRENDIQIEYLDRANLYNPTIVEVKDDAAIEQFGLKSNGAKQLHLFCTQSAALMSASLMLGRQQVRRTFCFTVGREFILLDPMDIIEITDTNAGLVNQWVRIKEITENDDRSLSIVAEEYLQGAGVAPTYGHQSPAPYVANYNLPAPAALAPIMFDAPVQIGNVLGMETILCTNGSGPNWGGCDVHVSSDNVTFAYAGTLRGGTVMGVTTATFGIGSDPDTADTLSVDLTESQGVLMPGTQADADTGNTLCLVDQELVTYEEATLTAQYKYDLGKHGGGAGYLRRGFYGSAIAAHSTGAPFARLKKGSYFTVGYSLSQVGQTIYVKLLSFNPWAAGKMTLANATSYSHTLGAPPAEASGLLAGVIQTPDIAPNAVTTSTVVSAVGPVTLNNTHQVVLSGSITLAGGIDTVFFNGYAENPTAGAVTIGGFFIDVGSPGFAETTSWTLQAGQSTTITALWSNAQPAGSNSFNMQLQVGAGVSGVTVSNMGLSFTETRR